MENWRALLILLPTRRHEPWPMVLLDFRQEILFFSMPLISNGLIFRVQLVTLYLFPRILFLAYSCHPWNELKRLTKANLWFQDAKDVVNSSKLWRRLPMMTSSGSSSPTKKIDVQDELSNIKIQKVWKTTFFTKILTGGEPGVVLIDLPSKPGF